MFLFLFTQFQFHSSSSSSFSCWTPPHQVLQPSSQPQRKWEKYAFLMLICSNVFTIFSHFVSYMSSELSATAADLLFLCMMEGKGEFREKFQCVSVVLVIKRKYFFLILCQLFTCCVIPHQFVSHSTWNISACLPLEIAFSAAVAILPLSISTVRSMMRKSNYFR